MSLLLRRPCSLLGGGPLRVHVASCRGITSNRKKRQQANRQKFDNRARGEAGGDLPLFQGLMRKLYLRAHPDLLLSHSETMSKINDNSMKELNGVLSTCKQPSEYPPAIDKVFVFYMKKESEYEKFSLHLKTSGGDSRKQLKRTFEEFFSRTGINNTPFRWDKEFTQLGLFPPAHPQNN